MRACQQSKRQRSISCWCEVCAAAHSVDLEDRHVVSVDAAAGVTALVFGREESGLTEAELRLCAHACGIQTGRMQGSMNLSHAVAVVLCGLFERRLALLGYSENLGMDIKGGDSKACSCLFSRAARNMNVIQQQHAAVGMAVTLVPYQGLHCIMHNCSADQNQSCAISRWLSYLMLIPQPHPRQKRKRRCSLLLHQSWRPC